MHNFVPTLTNMGSYTKLSTLWLQSATTNTFGTTSSRNDTASGMTSLIC